MAKKSTAQLPIPTTSTLGAMRSSEGAARSSAYLTRSLKFRQRTDDATQNLLPEAVGPLSACEFFNRWRFPPRRFRRLAFQAGFAARGAAAGPAERNHPQLKRSHRDTDNSICLQQRRKKRDTMRACKGGYKQRIRLAMGAAGCTVQHRWDKRRFSIHLPGFRRCALSRAAETFQRLARENKTPQLQPKRSSPLW